ncbi:hypothetical protein BT63DRAFT_443195 [Microthyrium microscopicum]|uniref:Uncharacterized protein n=1 Tax=Microthyrium microscopicum TaxID=703497 RepID=A0A6A6U172_9PEZI|nr:hypothetical protein BT63DRAFT_443195 [Microthyrium microscopicum]
MPSSTTAPSPSRAGLFTTPLTTVYSEPESCATSWFYHGITDPPPAESIRGAQPTPLPWVARGFSDKVGYNRPGGDLPGDCNPYPQPGASATQGGKTYDGLSMVIFSPGICPDRYSTVFNSWLTKEQHNFAVCCPSGYELLYPRNGAGPVQGESCWSTFNVPAATPVWAKLVTNAAVPVIATGATKSLVYGRTTLLTGVMAVDAYAVAWKSQDLTLFPRTAQPTFNNSVTTSPTSASTDQPIPSSSGISPAEIVIVSIATIFVTLILLLIAFVFRRRHKRRKEHVEEVQLEDHPGDSKDILWHKSELDGKQLETSPSELSNSEVYELDATTPPTEICSTTPIAQRHRDGDIFRRPPVARRDRR